MKRGIIPVSPNPTYQVVCTISQLSSVIEQCALKRDLELFDAGDLTEVGEKGITLR